ncbi:alpha/beta fold hydrolase [uncultured Mycobacterium sp.]|uniref:alpha/beta fold hydrolase n=1 Tax=uncultured Mycobacterium sp. TaxID=171292 RepID=UPI0035CC5534
MLSSKVATTAALSRSPDAPGDGTSVDGLAGFTHRYFDVNSTRLHAVVGGRGPALVLLHGWPYTWAVWRRVMPAFAAGGRTVIAPDLRGTGDSAKPETGYAKTNVAEDIRQLVAQVGFDDIDLIGMDIGAMVAYAYAAAHPDHVRHLVLSESVLPGFGLEELMNPAAGGYWHFGFHMQVDVAEMLTAGKEAAYLSSAYTTPMSEGGLTDADIADFLGHYAAPGGMRGGFQHYGTLLEDGRTNRTSFRAPLPMPVLVLNGEHGLPQEPLLNGVHRVASDVRSALVPDAAHTYAADNPGWVATRLNGFFSSGHTPGADNTTAG